MRTSCIRTEVTFKSLKRLCSMKSCFIYFYFYHYYYYILRNRKSIVLHQVNWLCWIKPKHSTNIKGGIIYDQKIQKREQARMKQTF